MLDTALLLCDARCMKDRTLASAAPVVDRRDGWEILLGLDERASSAVNMSTRPPCSGMPAEEYIETFGLELPFIGGSVC